VGNADADPSVAVGSAPSSALTFPVLSSLAVACSAGGDGSGRLKWQPDRHATQGHRRSLKSAWAARANRTLVLQRFCVSSHLPDRSEAPRMGFRMGVTRPPVRQNLGGIFLWTPLHDAGAVADHEAPGQLLGNRHLEHRRPSVYVMPWSRPIGRCMKLVHQPDQLPTRRSSIRDTPRGLSGNIGLMVAPS